MSRLDIPEETTGKIEDTDIKTIKNKALKEKKKFKKSYNRPWCTFVYIRFIYN